MHTFINNQREFTHAVEKANEDILRKQYRKYRKIVAPMTIVYLILVVWALTLAMQAPPQTRVLNITLAFVVPPLYIISHYLSMVGSEQPS